MMRRSITVSAFALISFAISAQSAPTPDASSTELAVISLDYQGSRMQRIDDSPTLSIYADGRVVMPQSYAHTRAYQGQISPAEVQSLLDFAIRDQQFLNFDEAAVKAKVASLSGTARSLPVHAGTTVISIQTNDLNKSVSYRGLDHDIGVEETERLIAIRNRLDRVMSVVKLGGADEAKRWLDVANAEISKDPSQAKRFTPDDLVSAAIYADGSAYVRFAQVDESTESSVSATISVDAAGGSHIAVALDDLLPRKRN